MGGLYQLCYRLTALNTFASTGPALLIGQGEFLNVTLQADSVTRVPSGGRYVLHYVVTTSSAVWMSVAPRRPQHCLGRGRIRSSSWFHFAFMP